MTTPHPSPAPSVFATTRWSLVLRAARSDAPAARAALAELCEAYWTPVFRFLRREGRTEDEARELTQEFFARLLAGPGVVSADPARGRFRSYLLGAVKHFLADAREHAARLKRGGGVLPESLDASRPAASCDPGPGGPMEIADPGAGPDDTAFDREWAVAIMDRALRAVQGEFERAGRGAQFRVLEGWLAGDGPAASQADAARALGMSEGAVKVAIHRLRTRFRLRVREELAQTLPDGESIDDELAYLVAVLRRQGA